MLSNYISWFLSTIASSAIALLTINFLSKKLVQQLLSKELEKYKSQLLAKTESLKSNLAIYAHEQNIANTRVDSQKAKAIHEVHSALRKIMVPASKISAGCPIMDAREIDIINYFWENSENTYEAGVNLTIILGDNAIYFSNSTYDLIKDLTSNISMFNAEFLYHIRKGKTKLQDSEELIKIILREQIQYKKTFDEKIKPKFIIIRDLFRVELGSR